MSRKSAKVRPRVDIELPNGDTVKAQVRVDPYGDSYYYATGPKYKGIKGDNAEELISSCQELDNRRK